MIKASGHRAEEKLPGIAAGHLYDEAADRAFDPGADFEELESNGADVRSFQFRAREADPADVRHQDIGAGGQQHTELVGDEVMATGAIREQTELLFLDAIFHVAALAVNVFVKKACIVREIGDNEAWVGFVADQVFGLGDDPAFTAPGGGGVSEFTEDAMGLDRKSTRLNSSH